MQKDVKIGVREISHVCSLEYFQRTHKHLLNEWKSEVLRLNACVEGLDKEFEALRRSEVESRAALATLHVRRNEDVAAGGILEKTGASEFFL